MGKSFFLGTEAELYIASEVFATKIAASASTYGLSNEQAEAFGALNLLWRNAYVEAREPASRTTGKVAAKNTHKAALKLMASDLAKIIAGTSTVTSEQKLELGLSVRAKRSPLPAPGTPNRFTVQLFADGAIKLRWKCVNPKGSQGTIYQVWRRVGDGGSLVYLGGTGAKEFTDETVPDGATRMTYEVQAVRSTVSGARATFNVRFGTGGAGRRASSIGGSSAAAVKIAA